MIGSLRGTLLEKTLRGEVLVDVGGVGYRALVPTGTLAGIGDIGADVFVHTHLHVREDALTLYGFATREERICFEALLGAHGVGPTLALAVLSAHSPASLRQALADDDVDALTVVPGVGKKTAARLLLELKTRLDVPELEMALDGPSAAHTGGGRGDVRAALASLGYGPDEVRDVLRELPPEGDVEELLRQSLKMLAARSRIGTTGDR
jgi:Holliday junction DNA helicase RuvA